MKILTINCYYKEYSTGKIISDIERELASRGCQFVHCYECGEKSVESNAYRLSGYWEYRVYYALSHLLGSQYGGGIFSNLRLMRILKKERPDIVHIHCPNAFSLNLYWLLSYLKKNKIATVITNHAEYFFTGNCAHADDCNGYMSGCRRCPDYKSATHSLLFNRTEKSWKKMKNCFEQFDKICMVAVSPWAEERIKTSTICRGLPCRTIMNGIDTDIFHYRPSTELFKKYKTDQKEKIFLHVTSSFSDDIKDKKGGTYILKLAQELQHIQMKCRILVVGPVFLTRAYDLDNIIFIGSVENQIMLAEIYSCADLLIMTSKKETFGLTCAESMCCGTPVVGFQNGGTESIALPEYSTFVRYGDLEALKAAVSDWSNKKMALSEKLCMRACEKYSKEMMALNYYELYKEIGNDSNS